MTITEKQNNYILSIIERNKDAKEYFSDYMEQTKDDPYARDLNKLLQTLIRIKDASEKHSNPISQENICKLDELCIKTPLFTQDVKKYMSQKDVKTFEKLREYDAIELKLLYIDKYIRRR